MRLLCNIFMFIITYSLVKCYIKVNLLICNGLNLNIINIKLLIIY